MIENEKRDDLLAILTETCRLLTEQHTVLVGLVRALIVDRADPETGARLVEIVESAFELNEAQRVFLAQMTAVAAETSTDEPRAVTAH